jgi:hypothetical protein
MGDLIYRSCKLLILWSHQPGLNRRPADYETLAGSQIAENTVSREQPTRPFHGIWAEVEQVSEQATAAASRPRAGSEEIPAAAAK